MIIYTILNLLKQKQNGTAGIGFETWRQGKQSWTLHRLSIESVNYKIIRLIPRLLTYITDLKGISQGKDIYNTFTTNQKFYQVF